MTHQCQDLTPIPLAKGIRGTAMGHVATIFLKILYIMGYKFKNVRNGKSISNTKMAMLFLALKSKFVRKFEFL